MKKILLLITISIFFVSCYQSRIVVGDMDRPKVEVAKRWNHSIIGGLVPVDVTMDATKYINKRENYEIVTYHSFVNQLLSGITCGIYTPTTTKIYLPIDDLKK